MQSKRSKNSAGLSLLEVLIALFILMVGLMGILAAVPTGLNSASLVVFQDAAIHLAHSKFSEFRRDRVDPQPDLAAGSTYLNSKQEPINSSGAPWHDFASAPGDTYEYFDDIQAYEWSLDVGPAGKSAGGSPAPAPNYFAPDHKGAAGFKLAKVTIVVRKKGTSREFRFTQYMCAYDQS
jgi:hypothetical protein